MNQPFRLMSGGAIDRSKPINFIFNGKAIAAFAGDTVASALLANGIKLVGRSFKYHRPRGILTHGSEEPNALLQVDRGPGRVDPNNRATVVEAIDGLVTRSQNHWPSLRYDLGSVNNLLRPILASGFYYKTFMWPRSFWDRIYEPCIRAAAGLGVAPRVRDPDKYVHRHSHCDVLVIGAGPAGIAAALAASQEGADVYLVDEQASPGGALLHDNTSRIDQLTAKQWLERSVATLAGRPNVTLLWRTTAFGYYNQNHIGLLERVSDHLGKGNLRERLWQVRARQVVIATGAHERPLVFADNDRPGIMLADSIRAFINRYAVFPGKQIVFVTNGPSAYRAAQDAFAAGAAVKVVDVRPSEQCELEARAVRERGIEVLTGHTVTRVRGAREVRGIIVAPLERDGTIGRTRTLPCDCIGMSGGWTPAVHLFSQSRGKLVFNSDIDAFVPGISVQNERSVGAAKGTYNLSDCLAEGWRGGLEAIGGGIPKSFSCSHTSGKFLPVRSLPSGNDDDRNPAFVDFQNDVTAKDIRLAVREGFESVEHIKRYTTTGMATDQGKTSNMSSLGIASEALSKPIAAIGTTTFRTPYTPVTFGALVGSATDDLFEPTRNTPTHLWAKKHGAVFENVGLWHRARYFPKSKENMRQAVDRECKAVRSAAGICDASTLGKIEVNGPDAAEFMNRIYINAWTKLEPGKCRYGLLLREDGYIFDDGVVARISRDSFHVTTTTTGAPRVFAHMEDYLQTEWPDLRVYLTSITEQWAVIAVQGPKAREIIAPFVEDIDLSSSSFPHMAVRVGHICGVPTRLFRVSFTGELGYEINVPSDYAQMVWESIYNSGKGAGLTPYGTEAMHVLRAERGFIIVGQETDGTVTPDDVGLAGMIAKTKPDFVGKRSLSRTDLLRSDRKQLVGLLTEKNDIVLDEGAQIVSNPGSSYPIESLGHVTSSYWSENCGRSIALALLSDGRARKGQSLQVTTPTGFTSVRVTEPVFVDPKGERVNV